MTAMSAIPGTPKYPTSSTNGSRAPPEPQVRPLARGRADHRPGRSPGGHRRARHRCALHVGCDRTAGQVTGCLPGALLAMLAAALMQGCATPERSPSEQSADRLAALHDAVTVY